MIACLFWDTCRPRGRASGMPVEGDLNHCCWLRHGRFIRVEDHLTLRAHFTRSDWAEYPSKPPALRNRRCRRKTSSCRGPFTREWAKETSAQAGTPGPRDRAVPASGSPLARPPITAARTLLLMWSDGWSRRTSTDSSGAVHRGAVTKWSSFTAQSVGARAAVSSSTAGLVTSGRSSTAAQYELRCQQPRRRPRSRRAVGVGDVAGKRGDRAAAFRGIPSGIGAWRSGRLV